jgi:predicted metal-dependent hydrolase
MTERLKINNYDIEILRRPRQRTLRLRVTGKGILRLTCAKGVPKREIFQFISSHLDFIEEQLEEARKIRERYPSKQFIAGETLLFFGRERKIRFAPGGERLKVKMLGGEFVLSGPIENSLREDRHRAVRNFFRRAGHQYLTQRLDFFARTMELFPKGVSFRCQSSRWGSCSGEGHVSLNWRLMAAPPDVIDYVVVHELSHLRHHDHSPRFWKLVAAFSPRYRELKNWLNQNQWALEFLAPSSGESL